MNYKILWTKIAYQDLSSIVLFIKETFGKMPAEEFVTHVDTAAKILSSFPHIGRIINTKKQIRGIVISKQIKLIYRIKSDSIIILNLFDTRQNPDKLQINEHVAEYRVIK